MIIIDRIEGDFAVCELPDGSMADIALKKLPEGIKPGQVLRLENGEYTVDDNETAARLSRISELQRRVFGE